MRDKLGQFIKGNIPWHKGKKKTVDCIICGNLCRTFKSRQRKYCSHKCHGIAMEGNDYGFNSENMKGNQINKGRKPWNYIDGRSKTMAPARYGDNWEAIRMFVYARDNFTCQDCGIKGISLDVHHKIPFLISFDNSLKNLISLCRSCHMKKESTIMKELKSQKVGV